jgi:hypothetical protein
MFVPHRKHTYAPLWPVTGDSFTLLYVDDVRTSQKTHLWAPTACYGNSFTFLYVDDVRTSQETHTGLHGLLRGGLLVYLFISIITHMRT